MKHFFLNITVIGAFILLTQVFFRSIKDNVPSIVVLVFLILIYHAPYLWIINRLCILSVQDISIYASAGLPAAKVLCGDVGVAGVASRAWGAVVGCLGWVVGWGPHLVSQCRGEGPGQAATHSLHLLQETLCLAFLIAL